MEEYCIKPPEIRNIEHKMLLFSKFRKFVPPQFYSELFPEPAPAPAPAVREKVKKERWRRTSMKRQAKYAKRFLKATTER